MLPAMAINLHGDDRSHVVETGDQNSALGDTGGKHQREQRLPLLGGTRERTEERDDPVFRDGVE